MTRTAIDTPPVLDPAAPELGEDAARGWYLYGITRGGGSSPNDDPALQLLECSGLAAVVRAVPLADFSLAVLRERVRSATELEAMVRSHNGVIEAVHARQAILPAKFGMVYADAQDLVSALQSTSDALLPQLHRLEGCDEWAVHLYVDRALVRTQVAATSPQVERLRAECAGARPGRAYFLERQIRDEVEAATRDALVALAQDAFDRLAAVAVAGEVSPVASESDAADEVEILRAAFLVPRDDFERFEAAVLALASDGEGLRTECSGPWPPYSFAAYGETVA